MSPREQQGALALSQGESQLSPPTITIVGGGLAGIAAAVEASQRGFRVELFEQSQYLGGRAASLVDSPTGQLIDCCPHVAMGCCTQFLDFCRRTGISDCFERTRELHLIGPDGRRRDVWPTRWFPVPLHLLPALMRLGYLSLRERWRIARALRRLTQLAAPPSPPSAPGPRASTSPRPLAGEGPAVRASISPRPLGEGQGARASDSNDHKTIGAWLRAQHQSADAIRGFWSVVLDSALGETVDHASLSAAAQVFREGFLASRTSSDLLLPRQPLREILHDRLAAWLTEHGVRLHLGVAVRSIEGTADRVTAIVLDDGNRVDIEHVVLAVPWRQVRRILSPSIAAAIPALADVDRLEPAAITAVHLWFDRLVVPLPHAVLVGRLGQWVFARSVPPEVSPRSLAGEEQAVRAPTTPRPLAGEGPAASTSPRPLGEGQGVRAVHVGGLLAEHTTTAQHCQVVISASHRLPPRAPDDWIRDVTDELRAIWPSADPPRLLHGRVVTQPSALFSVQPGVDAFRPPQQTPIANLAIAGDWTATGWPATMEGAVRSGRLAVDTLSNMHTVACAM
ncbi:MAG: FAD-dependent oxidoreductase [Planctomycetaceae bacterium]|nr:FAD-dependent oxidoreductase [Planctomycetaceae bacterium]